MSHINRYLMNMVIGHEPRSFITDSEIDRHLSMIKLTIISHGGVASTYLTKILNIKYPNVKIRRNPFHRKKKILTFENAFVHFPRPPITNKIQQCIYLYGDIYNSLISQIKRHPINSSKLCNDMSYPHISSFKQLDEIKTKDPFNIYKQIINFMNKNIQYPIILLKYGFSNKLIPLLVKITNI